jgi:hypothetical protein
LSTLNSLEAEEKNSLESLKRGSNEEMMSVSTTLPFSPLVSSTAGDNRFFSTGLGLVVYIKIERIMDKEDYNESYYYAD